MWRIKTAATPWRRLRRSEISPLCARALTGYARSKGAAVVSVEMGGRGEDEEHWAERIARGFRRALGVAGVLTPVPKQENDEESARVGSTTVLRPSWGGIFAPRARGAK